MAALLLAVIYLAFISLGLPDSLLGSAWPTMQTYFGVPSSYAGYVSMTIALMTIVSSLLSPKLIQKIQTKWIILFSIGLTIAGLIGFSFSVRYWMLFIFAVPYGLGAGAIDAALNLYVANHYSSRVMNFLHCFYGIGAIISPNVMAIALQYAHWNDGYRWTAYVQIGILAICLLSLPLWKINSDGDDKEPAQTVGIKKALKTSGVAFTLIAFFAYCAGEAICFLWTPSYFAAMKEGASEGLIAAFGSLIFGGLAVGRLIAGFISDKTGDRALIRIGIFVEFIGILLIALPIKHYACAMAGFLLTGIGMGPIYPSIQHMAPANFGKKYGAAVIGLQMASAYIGATFMPMLFGLIQQGTGIWIMPLCLTLFAGVNFSFLEITYKKIAKSKISGNG